VNQPINTKPQRVTLLKRASQYERCCGFTTGQYEWSSGFNSRNALDARLLLEAIKCIRVWAHWNCEEWAFKESMHQCENQSLRSEPRGKRL